ncbi:MAG: 2Fe-2S iron-sulfur cluster-binding protein [Magnetococcus sp. DMHC-6]
MSDGSGETVNIIFDGKPYQVADNRTILSALEHTGHVFVRGVGCRGGVCGACTVLYRKRGGFELKAALMCQEMVKEGMEIMPLFYFPQKQVRHGIKLDVGETPHYRVVNDYPEIHRCIMCGECTRLCPQGIDVMGYVGMIKRGDFRAAARESFICIQCQACSMRCPAQISHPNTAQAARLYHGKYQVARAEHLTRALELYTKEYLKGAFRRLRLLDQEELQMLYQRRELEPQDAPPGTWLPEDQELLRQKLL